MKVLRRSLNSEQRLLGSKSIAPPGWRKVRIGSSPMSPQGASYRAAGVDYETLDAGKRLALGQALATSPLLALRGGTALDASRGEPAFAFELGDRTLAFVVEGLGTKAMIARAVLEAGGANRFAGVAYDTAAATSHQPCCAGALAPVLNPYFPPRSSDWDGHRHRSPAPGERCRRG